MILSLFILMACVMQNNVRADKAEIIYEVFVHSFRDSNGDGIGDLQGLISKLDYIKDLGATAVWITPVHPSPSYHKYDVIDYYAIHPDYGTMQDMDLLISELHRRDMKLIMDFVINHTSDQHPWFIEASSSHKNPYHHYYVWGDYKEVQNEINKKETTYDSDNITQWHPGDKVNEHYYGFFWKGMPDLNFDNPKVREEIYAIGKFWIDKGVDGFRMDAARHIYPDDQLDATRKFWEEFTVQMKACRDDIKIIGEVWSDPKILATLFRGLPSLFNFELSKAIPEAINSGKSKNFIETYSSIMTAYKGEGVPYEDALLLGNHDINRIRSTLHGDIEKSKLASSILLTLPGTPYIYYGDEIGMLGVKPDEHIREPFLWGDDNFQRTSWLRPLHSTRHAVHPLLIQQDDEASIYHHYKKWIKIRKDHPAIATGVLNFIDTKSDQLLGYEITDHNKRFLTLHNLGNAEVEYFLGDRAKPLTGKIEICDYKIKIPPLSSMIFLIKE